LYVIAAPGMSVPVRLRIEVRGQVQGVGFRPFVHRLASAMGLGGWVRNVGAGVEIEVEGGRPQVELFIARLQGEAPAAARIEQLTQTDIAPRGAGEAFAIADSSGAATSTSIAPDSALCERCIGEIFDPRNRRYRHAFTHCTDCGPRYTITARLPYDRVNTSMAAFDECPACRAEREQPNERRFHAQTNACADCGPRLFLLDCAGAELAPRDPIAAALVRLLRGEIVAIKGVGGFHLVCDARSAQAVARLRERKAREEKPFAVMLASPASVPQLAVAGAADLALLASPERPIVLLPKSPDCDAALAGVAPDLSTLGVMLPSTPIQYLLFHEAAGRPDGATWLDEAQPLALVATSANPHGEPLVIDNDAALVQLNGIADAFLMHDRAILIRCDDSVLRSSGGASAPQMQRRARGYVPAPIRLGTDGAPGLALGAYLNNTICVARTGAAFVSQHIGDLDNGATCVAFDATVSHLLDMLQVEPRWVAADLHPDFYSSRFGRAFAERRNLPFIEVQHHHAHIGAVLAEHRVGGPALGLALDGVGMGADGAAWGGELLRVDGARCQRIGRLRDLPLPGGDRAAREPWRMGTAALFELGRGAEIAARFGPSAAMIATMLEKRLNTPRTSSAGRWFDAAAGLFGLKPVTSFEGQAAILFEALAAGFGAVEPMAGGYAIEDARIDGVAVKGGMLDLLPLLARLAEMNADEAGQGAALFHATLAAALAEWVARAATAQGIGNIVFGGGCFHNRILSAGLRAELEARGLRVFEAVRLPPGDGGLSLGQAWVAQHAFGDFQK
jgi:hydrogenase maturation protein HypF